MTTKLLKALKREHCIKLGVLDQKLKKSLYKLAFKRVRKALAAFRILSEMVSTERSERLKSKYTARGAFEYRDQTAHIGSSRPVGPNEKFLLKRVCRGPAGLNDSPFFLPLLRFGHNVIALAAAAAFRLACFFGCLSDPS